MHTYIQKGNGCIYNLNEYSDGTSDLYAWYCKTNTWKFLGTFKNVQEAANVACRHKSG